MLQALLCFLLVINGHATTTATFTSFVSTIPSSSSSSTNTLQHSSMTNERIYNPKRTTRMDSHVNLKNENVVNDDTNDESHQPIMQSFQKKHHPKQTRSSTTTTTTTTTRRDVLSKTLLLPLLLTTTTLSPPKAKAACLSGDTSPSCIGIYKMPIDDRANLYIETPEQLAKYAPDVKWVPPVVPPANFKEAKGEVKDLYIDCFGTTTTTTREDETKLSVQDMVLKGQLENAGIELLRIVPRITVAGRKVISALYSNKELSMKAYRAQVSHDELLGRLGEVDVLLGQALRGQLGVSAVAQIQILEELKEAKGFMEEFLGVIPDDFRG